MNERPSRRAATPVVPEPKNGSSTRSPALEAASSTRAKQRFGLLRRMGLSPALVLQPLRAGADRQEPVGADLHVLVAGLQRLVVERVGLGVRRLAPPRSSSRGRW